MTHMTQMTLRGFDKELERALRRTAKAKGLSLNQAALELMRDGAGLGPSRRVRTAPRDTVGDALDALIGTWSKAEEKRFLEAIAPLERIDPELWSESA